MKKILEFMKKPKHIIIAVLILAVIVASVIFFGWMGLWYDLLLAAVAGIILTGMKKYSLAKILIIMILLIVIISYLLPGRQNTINPIGIADVLTNYLTIILANFSYIILFVLIVGGFYGVLSKTPTYKKLLDSIVKFVKPMNKKFIYLIIILFAVIASLTSMTIPLFIFIPLIISVILLLGYDKLVAFTSTFGAIIIGYIGGVFVNFINPNTYGVETYEKFIGLENQFGNALPKLLLLLAGMAILIYFVSKHIKNVEDKKVKYELSDNSELLIAEVKGSYKDIKTWPLVVILILTFAITVIGIIPWNELFKIGVFTNFHTWLFGIKDGSTNVLGKIFSASLPALGEWNTSGNLLGTYIYINMLLIFVTIIIALINKIKFNDVIANFVEGAKKMIPIAIDISLAYMVLVCAYNNGFMETIITTYGKFNYGVSSLLTLVGCTLNVDTIWIVAGIFSPIVNLITDKEVYSSVAILFQGIYGIFSLVGPTSLILIIGLTYLDIPYTTWMKYIWRFILAMLILIALVTFLVTLI